MLFESQSGWVAAELSAPSLLCMTLTDKGITFKTDPAALAQMSFKLAQAFQKVEDDINTDALPKNVGYKLDSADIASWSK